MTQTSDQVRNVVREHYGKVAEATGASCAPGCCGGTPTSSSALGYSNEELSAVPEGANMGLGCGNPQAIAALKPGETVLDLGSGGGFDSFLAARQVGDAGAVIGVDMTPQMVTKARDNARKLGAKNVEFRLGEIERLPVHDASVDVILSNCVINLSPSKPDVFREAFRVLRQGGRLAISDVVATAPIPERMRTAAASVSGCIGGAATVQDLTAMLTEAGFTQVRIQPRDESRSFIKDWMPGSRAEDYIVSATIEAVKPSLERGCCGPQCCAAEGAA
jgi:arsenite methyltransferase